MLAFAAHSPVVHVAYGGHDLILGLASGAADVHVDVAHQSTVVMHVSFAIPVVIVGKNSQSTVLERTESEQRACALIETAHRRRGFGSRMRFSRRWGEDSQH